MAGVNPPRREPHVEKRGVEMRVETGGGRGGGWRGSEERGVGGAGDLTMHTQRRDTLDEHCLL